MRFSAGVRCVLGLVLAAAAMAPAGALAQELLVNGTFDDKTVAGWQVLEGQVYVVDWPAGDPRRVSLVLGYDNNASQRMRQTVTIPAGAGSATLRYSWYVLTEEDTHPWDQLEIRLLDGSGALLRGVETVTDAGPAGQWTDRVVDLSAYVGRTVTLELAARTDESASTQFRLDDLSLVAAAGTSGPRLTRVFLTDPGDQLTATFRPGDPFRVHLEFSEVAVAETVSVELRYFSAAGEDLGASPAQVNVSPQAPRPFIPLSFLANASVGDYKLVASFTKGGRTDSASATFSLVSGTAAGVKLLEAYTVDASDQRVTQVAPGSALGLVLSIESPAAQSATLVYDVLDPAGARLADLSWTGGVDLEARSAPWVLRRTLAGNAAAGGYTFRGSVSVGGDTRSAESRFTVTGTTAPAATCDREKAFVTDASNVERASYGAGQAIRLHACITRNVEAQVRWLVDDPGGVASPQLSGVGAVRATTGQPDWYLTRLVAGTLATGTYSLRVQVRTAAGTSEQRATFRLGNALPPEALREATPLEEPDRGPAAFVPAAFVPEVRP